MKIPGFILKRLYVKSSLRRIPGGFQFQLRNSLGSGYAKRVLPLKIERKKIVNDNVLSRFKVFISEFLRVVINLLLLIGHKKEYMASKLKIHDATKGQIRITFRIFTCYYLEAKSKLQAIFGKIETRKLPQ